jgi:SET domain-containing protein
MMRVPCTIAASKIHGLGVYAVSDIAKGATVWQFSRIFDRLIPEYIWMQATKVEQEKLFERGFRTADLGADIYMCGDEGAFLNFLPPEEANIELGGVVDGLDILVAKRDIKAGEELTVPPESDADYQRKMVQVKSEPERKDQ